MDVLEQTSIPGPFPGQSKNPWVLLYPRTNCLINKKTTRQRANCCGYVCHRFNGNSGCSKTNVRHQLSSPSPSMSFQPLKKKKHKGFPVATPRFSSWFHELWPLLARFKPLTTKTNGDMGMFGHVIVFLQRSTKDARASHSSKDRTSCHFQTPSTKSNTKPQQNTLK